MITYKILQTAPSADYELLDSGDSAKLERYGNVILERPDPQALWPKTLPIKEWSAAAAYFKREAQSAQWQMRGVLPGRWQIKFGDLQFWIKLSAFKHTGLFPEQLGNWEWLRQVVAAAGRPLSVLNLFGYTGGATLACAAAGAEVVHVDGSKVAISWARDNAALSGLDKKPIRWILDDAAKFVKREIKRGRQYDGIIMDPPAFGHGPGGQLWKIEDSFLPLLSDCQKVLSPWPLLFLINGYAAGYSALTYRNNLEEIAARFGGSIELGELTILERSGGRLLPAGIFARWSAK